MNRFIVFILLLFVVSGLQAQHLFTERSAKRGEILRVYVYPSEGIVSSRFTLVSNEGKIISHTKGFDYTFEDTSIETALLGIPSDVFPGKYTLKVFCETEEGSHQFTKPFFITEREFITMDIELNGDMSNLRASDDPKKAEQSRNLWSVISTIDEEAQYFDEIFTKPIKSYIETAFYGDRRNFIYSDGSHNRTLHFGSDLAAPVGEPVYAVGDGKLVLVENRILTGNTVIIEHLPGVFTMYYHMDSLSSELGMVVKKGSEIGTVGATGLVTGAHLHWEMRVSGVAVDPLLFWEIPLIDKDEIINIITSIH